MTHWSDQPIHQASSLTKKSALKMGDRSVVEAGISHPRPSDPAQGPLGREPALLLTLTQKAYFLDGLGSVGSDWSFYEWGFLNTLCLDQAVAMHFLREKKFYF